MAHSLEHLDVKARRKAVPPILIVAVCVFLSYLNWTFLSGREYGYFYGVFSDLPADGFAVSGPNYYQSMNIWYVVITLCFLAFIAFSFRREIDGFLLRMAALCVAIYPFFNMLDYKFDVIVNSSRRDYSWLPNSIYLDIVCLLAIVILMCLEIMQVRRTAASRAIENKVIGFSH